MSKTSCCSANPTQLHWFSHQPTPYNDYLFRHLARDESIQLLVHYRAHSLSSRPWKIPLAEGYNARFYKLFMGVDWSLLKLATKEKNAFFLIAGWDHPTSIIMLIILRLFNRNFALWTDTPDIKKKRFLVFSRMRTRFLNWIFDGAKRLLGTGFPGVEALKKMHVPSDRVINFPFFTDLTNYVKKAPFNHGRPLNFSSSGRIANSIKGHDIAIRALACAAAELEEFSFHYSIAGVGPDEMRIRELIKELDMEERVKLLGWVDPNELNIMYQNTDILIHPSPSHDPFPNAVLEGMASGLVVLGSDASGSVIDRIENGVNGFIHTAGNVKQLAEQIIFLNQNPERLHEIAANARATAESWPIRRGVAIIKELVERG